MPSTTPTPSALPPAGLRTDPPAVMSLGPWIRLASLDAFAQEFGLTAPRARELLQWMNTEYRRLEPSCREDPIPLRTTPMGPLPLSLHALLKVAHRLTAPSTPLSEAEWIAQIFASAKRSVILSCLSEMTVGLPRAPSSPHLRRRKPPSSTGPNPKRPS